MIPPRRSAISIGFAILGPRLLDTLLGCLISYGLVAWLWPDWQYKRLPTLIANSLSANARYPAQRRRLKQRNGRVHRLCGFKIVRDTRISQIMKD